MTDEGGSVPGCEVLDPTSLPAGETVVYDSSVFVRRSISLSDRCEIVCDTLAEDGLEIRFLRWTVGDPESTARFRIPAESSGLVSNARMGTLFTAGADEETPVLWLPRAMTVGRTDRHGRLATVDDCTPESWWELSGAPTFHIRASAPAGSTVHWPMVVFDDRSTVRTSDLLQLNDIEAQRFLKSDWFDASSPADLWRYLVAGSVYDPRSSGPGRVRCQQCAFAWWGYLMALYRRTGKSLYRSLARAVAWSVRVDLGDDETWLHGFWHSEPEVHCRLLWDGVRLLLCEHELAPHADLLDGARRVSKFAVEHLTEELNGGRLWFLHDSVEGNRELRVGEPVLGRSASNSLCLNTHVQALCTISQLNRIEAEAPPFHAEYQKAMSALEAALGLVATRRPVALAARFLPRVLAWKIPHRFSERVCRFLTYRLLVRVLWWVRSRALCLVFPGGYLDRDIGRTLLADEYHVINLKDLVELQRLDPQSWLQDVVAGAYTFGASVDFERALERHPIWAEWVDVLESSAGMHDPAVVQARKSVANILGGRTLDALCASLGVWPSAGPG